MKTQTLIKEEILKTILKIWNNTSSYPEEGDDNFIQFIGQIEKELEILDKNNL